MPKRSAAKAPRQDRAPAGAAAAESKRRRGEIIGVKVPGAPESHTVWLPHEAKRRERAALAAEIAKVLARLSQASSPQYGYGLVLPDPHTNTIAYRQAMRAIRAQERAVPSPPTLGKAAARSERKAPAAVSKRGTLSKAALERHLTKYKIGFQMPDGSLFNASDRARALERDEHITVHRSTISKRLKLWRLAHPAPTS